MTIANISFEKFRLRSLVERLIERGEVEIHEEPVCLADLSGIIESTPKATLFKQAGPEKFEIIAAVAGSRSRMAAAFGVDESGLISEYTRRMSNPQPIVEVPSAHAPVHEVIKTGDDIDLARLPFHFQHEFDGGPYISAGIDYSVDPATGKTNVGCRRLMMRSRREMRSNLSQPSDLKRIYLACVERGERLPVSFAIGSHPLDFLAATLRLPTDEFGLVATLRGEPVPMVRGLTNGVLAPADAEMIIEGYFDELGYRELEGPYGEFWGVYGPVHIDPVFHVTAITTRRDVLYQTVLHGTSTLSQTECAHLSCLNGEAHVWKALREAGIQPSAVRFHPGVASRQHVRVALPRTEASAGRRAIDVLFGIVGIKHVTIVDDDVDLNSDEAIEWAMSTRFRADRDVVVASGCKGYYADPTADKDGLVAKIGFDLTAAYGVPQSIELLRPRPPKVSKQARKQNVRQALQDGPMYFFDLMNALGSTDGREIALQLDELREEGVLDRLSNGEWTLKKPS